MTAPAFAPTAPAQAFATTIARRLESEPAPRSAPSVPPPPEARYEVGKTLGEGGMGRVLQAVDALFGREVALKEMREDAATIEGARRFVVESLVTGNLEHPGVVPVYDRGIRDGRPFYTMRKLDGRTLADAIDAAADARARLALLPAIVKVAHTLAFAHERGVVHRDLKPANVVLGRHGEVTVIDWGIARVGGLRDVIDSSLGVESAGSGEATAAGSVMGTPAYMAPEQAAGRIDEIDARTDVFSIGAMIYELLSGRAPYRGTTAMATLAEALEGRREPLHRVAAHAPEALRAICDRAMAHAPADRFPSAAELARALEDFSAGVLTAREPAAVRWLTGAIVVLFAAGLVYALLGALSVNASILEQGPAGVGVLFVAFDGSVLALVEWRTRGKYRLLPFGIAFGLATFLLGLGGSASGFGLTMGAVAAAGDGLDVRLALLEGAYESIGLLAMSSIYAAVEAFLWALAWRATAARRDAEASAR